MLNFKEGQTYICTESNRPWWTEGKEYYIKLDDCSVPYLEDDDFDWHTQEYLNKVKHLKFTLKDVPVPDERANEEPPMEKELVSDLIDNQAHYKNQGIEPIELMRKNFSKEEFAGFLQGNVLKYMLRYKDKNGLEDLKKAMTYLTWLIEEEEKC